MVPSDPLDTLLEQITETLYEEAHQSLSRLFRKDLINDLFTVVVTTEHNELSVSMDIGAEVLSLSDLSLEESLKEAFESALKAATPLIEEARVLLKAKND